MENIEATSVYALLLNLVGKKCEAYERLNTLWNHSQTIFDNGLHHDISLVPLDYLSSEINLPSKPLLWLALAYADLSREKSFFDTKIISCKAT